MSNDNGHAKMIHRKPLPWRCGCCGEKAVKPALMPFTQKANLNGRTYKITIPDLEVARCELCGESSLDRTACARIDAALRKEIGLMDKEEILSGMSTLGINENELAEALGENPEIVASWLKGFATQPKSMDNLIRVYFQFPDARAMLNARRTTAAPDATVPDEVLAVTH